MKFVLALLRSSLPLLVALAGNASVAQTTVAGSTSGQFSVSESGAASYQVAIQVPPGVAGMAPRLALVYNSQGGNGLMGMGWGLSGLSTISRCPQTKAQDGVRGVVDFTLNDRFCMDGQRLILVSGTYGAAGSEYRTESDNFSKIVANLQSGNGPTSFTVQTKAGVTMEYGTTADSRVATNFISSTSNPTISSWAISKMTDVAGNVMTVSYTPDAANGSHYPARVDYAGNAVVFAYEARTDVVPMYHVGSMTKQAKRLKSVTTYATLSGVSTAVQTTVLAYRATLSTSTGRTLLQSVKLCDGTGTGKCLAPINLTWLDTATEKFIRGGLSGVMDWGYDAGRAWVDVNGDGRTDYCRVLDRPSGTKRLRCDLSSGFGIGTSFLESDPIEPGYDASRAWVDINGDGMADYCRVTGSGPSKARNLQCNLSLGTSAITGMGFWQTWTSELIDVGYDAGQSWADVNGDGIPDFCRVVDLGTDKRITCRVSSGPGFGVSEVTTGTIDPGWDSTRSWVDVNGDGLADYCRIVGSGPVSSRQIQCTLSTGTGFGATWTSGLLDQGYDAGRSWADVNGDGQADFCRVIESAGTRLACTLSTGVGFGDTLLSEPLLPGGDDGRAWVDANGDGLADYCRVVGTTNNVVGAGGAEVRCTLSTGTGFGATVSAGNSPAYGPLDWGYNMGRAWVDVNGDGKADYCRRTGSDNLVTSYVECTNSVPYNDLLDTISSPNGSSMKIDYVAQSGVGSVYTKDAPFSSNYPRYELQTSQYVVSQAQRSDGIGGMLATQYAYGGQKAELGSGRGQLGFRWFKSTEVATGVETYTEYSQEWPYTGTPLKAETRLSGHGNGGVLKRTTTTPGCLNPQTAAPCTVAVGNLYFPYAKVSVEESWDLNGAAFPTVTTEHTYGADPSDPTKAYGDPTTIKVTNSDGSSKTVVNEYWPANTSAGNWILGRLKRATATSTAPDTGPGSPNGDWLPPTITVVRTPKPMQTNKAYSVTWNTTGATSVSYDCTASGTGYVGRGVLAANGTLSGTADGKWVGFDSKCLWTASGPGGTKTVVETLNTVDFVLPTVVVTRTPAIMVAEQAYTVVFETTNATSLSYNCTTNTVGGDGYSGTGPLTLVNGIASTTGVADMRWINHPSSCTYTVTGPGGSKTATEALTTTGTPAALALTACTTNSPTNVPTRATLSCTVSNTGQATAESISYTAFAGVTVTGPTGKCYGKSACGTVTVTTDSAAGVYAGNLTVTPASGAPASTPVNLVVSQFALTGCVTQPPMTAPGAMTCTLVNITAAAANSITYSTPAGTSATGPTSCTAYTANCGTVTVNTGSAPGIYSGTLTVTTNTGASTTAPINIEVKTPVPTVTVSRTPATMVAEQTYTATWTTTNATSLTYACVSTPGTDGYAGSGTLTLVNGVATTSGTADKRWIDNPSTCTYTATGPGGSKVLTEILTTAGTGPALALTGCVSTTPTNSPTPATMRCTLSNTGQTTAGGIGYTSFPGLTVSGPTGKCYGKTVCGTVTMTTGTGQGLYAGNVSASTIPTPGNASITTSVAVRLTVDPPIPAPTLSIFRNPSPVLVGRSYTLYWNTTNATSVTYSCSAGGTGYSGSGTLPSVNGYVGGTGLAAWVNYPSSCSYTATGPGGTKTVYETMYTVYAPPNISVQRNPAPVRVGQSYTLYWSTTDATSVTYSCTASGTGFSGSGSLPSVNGNVSGTGAAAWVGYPSSCSYTATGPGGSTTAYETMVTNY